MSPLVKALGLAAINAALVAVVALSASYEIDSWPRAAATATVSYSQPDSPVVHLDVRSNPTGLPQGSVSGRCRHESRAGELTCVYDPERGAEWVWVAERSGRREPGLLSQPLKIRIPAGMPLPQVGRQVRVEVGLPPRGQVRALRILSVGPPPSTQPRQP